MIWPSKIAQLESGSRLGARGLVLGVALSWCGAATAAPQVTAAPSFLLVERAGGVAAAACAPPTLANEVVTDFVQSLLRSAGLDPQLAVVLLSHDVGCNRLFYVPIANDVRGIGYAHENDDELFDHSPESRLEGIAFLNDVSFAREHRATFAREFNHELGHRWGSRVQLVAPPLPADALLGRERQHWSYFLDSGGSPLEGNAFEPSSLDSVSVDTPLTRHAFSKLDLYLMGVLEPELVGPLNLYQPKGELPTDCEGAPLNANSPPQTCGALRLRAEPISVGVDAIIAAEGPRSPAAKSEPRTLDVAFLVVSSGATPPTRDDCADFSAEIDQRLLDFATATEQRLTLDNLTSSPASCADWPASEQPAERAVSCALRQGGRRSAGAPPPGVLVALSLLLLAGRRVVSAGRGRRRRVKGERRRFPA